MKNRFLKLTSIVILGTTIFFGCSKNTVDSKSTTTPVTKITSNTSIQTKINSTSSSTITSSTTKEAENTKTKVSTKENGSASNEEVKDEYSKYSNKKNGWGHANPANLSAYNATYSVGKGNVALTFDLGYETGYTSKLLAELRSKGAKATFFITGTYAKKNPTLVKQMIRDGHKIGMHGYNHQSMVSLVVNGKTALLNDIAKWKDASGLSTNLYRAPEGVYSQRGLSVLKDNGYKTVFWGFALVDWDEDNQMEPSKALSALKKGTLSGDIVLLHVYKTNVTIIGDYIDYLRSVGLNIVQP